MRPKSLTLLVSQPAMSALSGRLVQPSNMPASVGEATGFQVRIWLRLVRARQSLNIPPKSVTCVMSQPTRLVRVLSFTSPANISCALITRLVSMPVPSKLVRFT